MDYLKIDLNSQEDIDALFKEFCSIYDMTLLNLKNKLRIGKIIQAKDVRKLAQIDPSISVECRIHYAVPVIEEAPTEKIVEVVKKEEKDVSSITPELSGDNDDEDLPF